jgi:hypothetical protein
LRKTPGLKLLRHSAYDLLSCKRDNKCIIFLLTYTIQVSLGLLN